MAFQHREVNVIMALIHHYSVFVMIASLLRDMYTALTASLEYERYPGRYDGTVCSMAHLSNVGYTREICNRWVGNQEECMDAAVANACVSSSVYNWELIKARTLQWRHNERDGISNLQPHDCLLNSLFKHRKHRSPASRAFVGGIHRWPVNSPHKGPVTRKRFPFDDVIIISCVSKLYATSISLSIPMLPFGLLIRKGFRVKVSQLWFRWCIGAD